MPNTVRANNIYTDSLRVIIGNLTPLVFALLTIPYLLDGLGAANYGIFVIIVATVGYLSVFDLGVGKSMTYFVSRANNIIRKYEVLSSGIVLSILAGFLFSFLIFTILIVLVVFDILSDFVLQKTVIVVCFTIIPTTLTTCVRGFLEGNNEFVTTSINKAIIGSLLFLFPAISVFFFGDDIFFVSISILCSRIIVLTHLLFHVDLKKINFTKLDLSCVKELLAYGGWVSISSFISPLMLYGDRYLISFVLGPTSLPLYSIPQEIIQRLLIFPGSFCTSILPKISGDVSHYSTYHNYIKVFVLFMFPLCSVVAVIFPLFMEVWISAEFSESVVSLAYALLIGIFFNSLAQLSLIYLYALGKTKFVAKLQFWECWVYLSAVYFSVLYFGVLGAAFCWTIRAFCDLLFLHFTLTKLMRTRFA